MTNPSPLRALLSASILVASGAVSAACASSSEPAGPASPGAETPAAPETSGETETEPKAPSPTPAPSPTSAPSLPSGPSFVSSAPANGEQGVASDASIVLKFDRAMDEVSVAAAYVSVDLPKEEVSLAWNAAGNELTIVPAAPLAYAEGGPETVARAYGIRITTAAKDKEGRPLAKEASVAFTTLRRITQALPMISVMSGRVLSNATFSSGVLAAGDFMNGGVEREARASLTYMLDLLPQSPLQLEKATLKLSDANAEGAPDFFLGVIHADHVTFAVGSASFGVAPMTSRIVTSNFQAKTRTVDVTDMFADDLANRADRSNRSQFRLRYASAPSGNNQTDITYFDKSTATLEAVYLSE